MLLIANATHEPADENTGAPLNELKAREQHLAATTDHELCHTPLNELKVREQHPSLPEDQVVALATAQYHQAATELMVTVLQVRCMFVWQDFAASLLLDPKPLTMKLLSHTVKWTEQNVCSTPSYWIPRN
jgi:hypothetical protein